jgi:hypothetical protein
MKQQSAPDYRTQNSVAEIKEKLLNPKYEELMQQDGLIYTTG